MIKQIILSLTLFISFPILGQELIDDPELANPSEPIIYAFTSLDEAPKFKECIEVSKHQLKECFRENLLKNISKKLSYPQQYRKRDSLATIVYMKFSINKEGGIFNIVADAQTDNKKIKRKTEKKAVRIINKLPKLVPAIHGGVRVNTQYMLPMFFPKK